MKTWLVAFLLAVAAPLFGAEADVLAKLNALKAAFPTHISGPVTKNSDPLVVHCYDKYKDAVAGISVENLVEDVRELRIMLERDIDFYDYKNSRAAARRGSGRELSVLTPSMRVAYGANLSWLKSKIRPFVARLESLQRGK